MAQEEHPPTSPRRRHRRRSVGGGGSGALSLETQHSLGPAAANGEHAKANRFKSFRVRLYSTVVLIASFLAIVYAGHVPLMFMILGIQTLMVRELFALARVAQRERRLPGFRAQQWYVAGVAAFWLYTRFVERNLVVEVSSSARLARALGWALRRHTVLSFWLYTAGFVAFVLTLEKRAYAYQFVQFAWTHMILLVVFLPSSCFVSAVFEGIFWFLLPCALVIVNDIAAYLAGFFFGRTPLIRVSPKKTWEGFAGGLVATVVASWFLAAWMSRSPWLTCPRTDLSVWRPLRCAAPPEVFRPRVFRAADALDAPDFPWVLRDAAEALGAALPGFVTRRLAAVSFVARPAQLHAVVLALFASAIAPFGGFFASGFKRGFKIKDFGRSIPGHGGMTDRMDCQVVMAAFSHVYYHAYVAPAGAGVMGVGAVLAAALRLPPGAQLELLEALANVAASQRLLPPRLGEAVGAAARAAAERERARGAAALPPPP